MPVSSAELAADYVVVAPNDENKLFMVTAAGATRTITCPTGGGLFGAFQFAVIKTDASNNPVVISASATINGVTTLSLHNQWDCALLRYSSNEGKWYAHSTGRLYVAPSSVSASFTATKDMHRQLKKVDASAAARIVTLPNTLPSGFVLEVQKTDSSVNTVTLDATAGGNINGAATFVLRAQYEGATVTFDGATWSTPVVDKEEPGMTKFWWLEVAPTGWAFCEGQAISRASNPRLFALLGVTYGAGDGSTTFNLPNPRGRFPRVWDHAAGVDPDAASRTSPPGSTITAGDHIGTLQADAFKSHIHTVAFEATGETVGGTVASRQNGLDNTTDNTGATGGNETRGINMAVGLIIKLG